MSEPRKKNTKQAEKHCGTCQYRGDSSKVEPCSICDEMDKWEALEPECVNCESGAVKSCEYPCKECFGYSHFYPTFVS